MAVPAQADSGVFSARVEGSNLRGRTFGENLDSPATLVVFLRHFG